MENQTHKKRGRAASVVASTTTGDRSDTGCKRRRRGRLELIMKTPIDVFSDIAKHLAPDDLLHLARSSRALREVLMSRNSTGVWKAAEEGIGLPACPSDLSSPQYASLIFDTFCMDCEVSGCRVRNFDYTLRFRLCKDCYCKNVFHGPDAEDNYKAIPGVKLHQLVPCSIISCHQTSDLSSIDESSEKFGICAFYKKEVDAAVEKYLAVGSNPDSQQAFLAKNEVRILSNELIAAKVKSWVRGKRSKRLEEKHEAVNKRRESALSRLRKMGYDDGDFNVDLDEKNWEWNTLIKQPSELTDRIWQRIAPKLQVTIKLRREKRLKTIRTIAARKANLFELLQEFVYPKIELPAEGILHPSTFFKLPVIAELLNKDGFDETISPELWKTAEKEFIKYDEKLKQEMRGGINPPAETSSDTIPTGASTDVTHTPARPLAELPYSSKAHLGTVIPPAHMPGVAESGVCALQQTLIATLLGRRPVLSNSNTSYRQLLQSRFICCRCDVHERTIMSWEDLVVHFSLKKRMFTELQGPARTLQISQHDIYYNRRLAISLDSIQSKSASTQSNTVKPIYILPGLRVCRCGFCEKVPIGFFTLEIQGNRPLPAQSPLIRDHDTPT